MSRWLVFCLILGCLTGCNLIPVSKNNDQVEFIPMARPIGPKRRIVQHLTAVWSGHQENLLCVLELNNQGIAIAGLSDEGISLFNLSYDGKKLVVDKSPLLTAGFIPELVVKDLQLAYWPAVEIQKILPLNWRLEANAHSRRLYFNNQLQADVDYSQPDISWPKSVNLTNHQYRYRLQINTISYETVPE